MKKRPVKCVEEGATTLRCPFFYPLSLLFWNGSKLSMKKMCGSVILPLNKAFPEAEFRGF